MVNSTSSPIFSAILSGLKLICTVVLLVLSSSVYSQEGSKIFASDEDFDPKTTGNLLVAVDNLNFFKNNEYKSKYVSGYTLGGSWIRSKLLYYPDKKFRFEIGGQVLKYIGRDEYLAFPWFAAVYQPEKHLTLRMGNLNWDQNHGLSEPALDSEHYLDGKPEAGIQAKFKSRHLKADMWIDWQRMIFKGDPFKERFVFGTVLDGILFEKEDSKLTLPVTFSGLHEGGEIDTAPGLAQTHIVVSEGLKYEYQTGGSLVKSGRLQGTFFQSTYPLNETALPAESGTAFFIQTAMNTDFGSFGTGFWQGKDFFSPLGMPLYQNGAIGHTVATSINRLWVFSYRYDRKIFDKSKFGFTSDLFYNPITQKISNNAALYLMVNLSALLRKSTN